MAGKRLHELLEEYLKWDGTGTQPAVLTIQSQEAKTARAMMAFLPTPPQARVEEPFTLEIDGTKWRGVKDLVYTEGYTLVVHDHKSTSSLEWAKSPEDLRRDIQSIIYARDAFQESDLVDLQWLYGTRETHPRVQPVRFSITFEEVTKALPPILEAGKRVLKLYDENPSPTSLPKSLDSCYAFGKPCPFMEECGLSTSEQVQALLIQSNIKDEKKMGFRDRVKVEAVPNLTTEPINKPSMAERLGFGSAVTPPAYVKPEPKAPEVPTPESPKGEEMVPDAPPVSEESVAATKPRRGRPPGTKNKKVEVNTVEVGAELGESFVKVIDELANEALKSVKSIPDVPHDRGPGFILLVNTIPVGYAYTALSEYLRPVLNAIQVRNGVEDYRLIDYKAKGMLAAELFTFLETHPPEGFLFVDANTDEGRDCLPTLERFAREIYRSV